MEINLGNIDKITDTDEFKKFELEFDNNIEFLQDFSNPPASASVPLVPTTLNPIFI